MAPLTYRRNRARNRKIIALRKAGHMPLDIQAMLGLTEGVVSGVLQRAGLIRPRLSCHGLPDGTYVCDLEHCYHESTARRLEWQYGENRVNAADISAWNSLGQRREIAA